MSPYWTYNDATQTSPSHGAALSIAYAVVLRWAIKRGDDLIRFILTIVAICTIYAAYFLVNATALDIATSRVSVVFANANFTGAVLAFGAAATLWVAVFMCDGRRLFRVMAVACYTLQILAVYQTGSRASFAGVALTLAIMVIGAQYWRAARNLTVAVLIGAFVVGFVPGFADQLRDASEKVSLVGWRPGMYYRPAGAGREFLAHSWGLEYMASVGLLGTAAIVVVLTLWFRRRGNSVSATGEARSWLWTSVTAVALAPNLALSTHQWTLWAWAGFALWSLAYLLAPAGDGADRVTLPAYAPR